MRTTAICVLDYIDGNHCINAEHGHQLGGDLLRLWNSYDRINLDFEGVDLLLSSFLFTVYQQLLSEYTIQQIYDKIVFVNMNENGCSEKKRLEKMHHYIYKNDIEMKLIIANIIEGEGI
ncbi:MAG: STAS-like domain-containing protein [Bacteroidales bacterium]